VRGALLQLALDLCGEESQRIASLAGELGLAHQERQRLGSWRTTVRAEAAKNLGLLRVREALPALLHALKFDPQPSVRLAAVWALGEIGGRKSVLGLLAMLEDLDLGVVRRAQEILLDSARDAASEIVDFVRRSEVPAARRAAVDVLRGLADPRATDLLVELADDPDVELRIKAVKAAAALADPRCAELFRRGLSDARWEVRCQAARGLGALGNRDAVGLLWEALADPVWWVRFNAASALEELGSAGDAALERAARDAHRQRREVARYVLERSSCGERAA
jgi:HEAT repeat protein